ncbi:hypothetical protein M413DRAFT_30389 [Hebeloma cylindrosporum]|uniref:Uncharacterized protein n=1 Tax=Hebeloma cylindrosporum TaxID=76867 RepID=A0A0C2YB88_HEBCY|nr:hypothetical protein M413DRAFT_30389 [Hebeloma cylindrosporum h7]
MPSENLSSRTGSWSYKLYDILRPSRTQSFAPAPSGSRHLPGDIWRHAFSVSVYADLEAFAEDSYPISWRRFVRLEHFGLSGVIFYEIRRERSDDSRHLTLKTVFGDLNDPADLGMDLDKLLDMVQVKVIYFPAYACTSFVIGQVMTAFLLDKEELQPYPAPEGFLIPCAEEERYRALDDINAESLLVDGDRVQESWYSYDFSSDEEETKELLSIEPDSPYRALCIRSSTLPHSVSFEEKDEGNSTVSTVDSIGPRTPPLVKAKSESNSPSKSSGLPACLSTGRLWLSMYDDMASFLDFSATQADV